MKGMFKSINKYGERSFSLDILCVYEIEIGKEPWQAIFSANLILCSKCETILAQRQM